MASAAYERAGEWPRLFDRIRELRPRTVVLDVEPLIAHWDTDEATLRRGVAAVVDEHLETAGVEIVVFSTNSWRRLHALPGGAGVSVAYLRAARKPLRVAPYKNLPRPGVVVGDQVAAEGVLAKRLGYTFIHWTPVLRSIPPGACLVKSLNRPLARLLFPGAGRRRRSEGVRGSKRSGSIRTDGPRFSVTGGYRWRPRGLRRVVGIGGAGSGSPV